MEKVDVLKVLDIYLDTKNPRHPPISSQLEIITYLIKHEKITNLAKDIATVGISPIEPFAVMKDENGHYIALEGNRRLCALTLLNDPNRAPTNKQAIYFKRLSEKSKSFPSEVQCVVFDGREEADIWIERRHLGAQDGVGTREWSPEQQSRHSRGKVKSDVNALALGILEYASSQGFLPEKEKLNELSILTTASRYLGNPNIRRTFGIVTGRTEADVVINATFEEFNRVIERFSSDLLNKTSGVNSRTNSADWEAYADLLMSSGIAPTKVVEKRRLIDLASSIGGAHEGRNTTIDTGESMPFESENASDYAAGQYAGVSSYAGSGSNGSFYEQPSDDVENFDGSGSGSNFNGANSFPPSGSNVQSAPRPGTTRNPDDREYLIPSSFKAPIKDRILRRIFEELKLLYVDGQPLAVSLVARVFLENVYVEFFAKKTGNYPSLQTHVVMERIIKLIEQDASLTKKEKNALAAFRRVQSNTENILNPKSLGANAHGGNYPSAIELKREWDNISSIIEYMLRVI